MNVIIAGTRDFDRAAFLHDKMNALFEGQDITIISGTARGADRLGEIYASHHELPIKRFPAQWVAYGKSAGAIRNEEMAKEADILVAFWDGKSKGTKNMIDNARKYKLETHIYYYENQI